MKTKEKNIQRLAEQFIFKKSESNFKMLFERLKPGISNHCFLILKDLELADDAFINTMSKIWDKIDQYESERGNFSTWCYNIARNESLKIIKEESRYSSQDDSVIDNLYSKNTLGNIGGFYTIEEDPNISIFKEEGKEDYYEKALEEILSLPDIYRDIMIDREINRMKYKDIAEKYEMKKRSVATRIRRARAKIVKKIEESKNKNKKVVRKRRTKKEKPEMVTN
jgi:RNA polymerase sigma-70 factor (ECF subfamily)